MALESCWSSPPLSLRGELDAPPSPPAYKSSVSPFYSRVLTVTNCLSSSRQIEMMNIFLG